MDLRLTSDCSCWLTGQRGRLMMLNMWATWKILLVVVEIGCTSIVWTDMEVFAFDQPLCPEHKELYSWKPVVSQTSLLVLCCFHTYKYSSNKTTPDLYSICGPSDHALPEPLKPDTGCPCIRLNQSARTAGHLLLVGACKYLLQRHLSCRVALELEFIPFRQQDFRVRGLWWMILGCGLAVSLSCCVHQNLDLLEDMSPLADGLISRSTWTKDCEESIFTQDGLSTW